MLSHFIKLSLNPVNIIFIILLVLFAKPLLPAYFLLQIVSLWLIRRYYILFKVLQAPKRISSN
jgi:hypothetical protein